LPVNSVRAGKQGIRIGGGVPARECAIDEAGIEIRRTELRYPGNWSSFAINLPVMKLAIKRAGMSEVMQGKNGKKLCEDRQAW
jgi:hypothetical protein